jgi:hypothetical protein
MAVMSLFRPPKLGQSWDSQQLQIDIPLLSLVAKRARYPESDAAIDMILPPSNPDLIITAGLCVWSQKTTF